MKRILSIERGPKELQVSFLYGTKPQKNFKHADLV